ncbi:ATP-binding protein [Bdellovibrionota bacterium FG-1]
MPQQLLPLIQKDLERGKMVFLGGPRQVGKTTLAKKLLTGPFQNQGRYFNWDYDEDKLSIKQKKWVDSDRLLIFDELHKYPKWKNWIKGVYDVQRDRHQFLLTGSARMNVYRRGSDSLMGRYFNYRLHPFTLDDHPEGISVQETFTRLMSIGGFPEPFIDSSPSFHRRWQAERFVTILKEDARDLALVKDIENLRLFATLLRQAVGGPIVLSKLANDIQISATTAKKWLQALELLYIGFAVRPFTRHLPRAIQKPPKFYFYDNADVFGDTGARFENLVAAHLLKRIQFIEDTQGISYELGYLRDKEGHEVDFVLHRDGKIQELIEVKTSDAQISSSLRYFKTRLKPPFATQIVAELPKTFEHEGVRVVDPLTYFSGRWSYGCLGSP